jgi:threonine dehydrogenase-like Zn-dependent dehydrogenase
MDISPKAFPAAVPGGSRTYFGHELVGEIVELGSEVEGFALGDRIAQRIEYPACSQIEISPPCRQCAEGNYALCENAGLRPLACEHPGAGKSKAIKIVLEHTEPAGN